MNCDNILSYLLKSKSGKFCGRDIFIIRTGLIYLPSIRKMKKYSSLQIKTLAEDISSNGFYEPISVLKVGTGSFAPYFYQIINGELRYRACLYAGVPAMPCVILGEMPFPSQISDEPPKDTKTDEEKKNKTKIAIGSPVFFLNSVMRSADTMNAAGYKTEVSSSEDDGEITVKITIQKKCST